jgi:hypothetical protein
MAEINVRRFIVREKHCPLTEKVRFIRQANRVINLYGLYAVAREIINSICVLADKSTYTLIA